MTSTTRNIAILGSTGSIGTQTLDIIAEYPDRFRACVLTAGSNTDLLAAQARRFMPDRVVIGRPELLPRLRELLADLPVETMAGPEAIAGSAALEQVDTVVTAMVGYSGLAPTVSAIRAGKTIALANKETLVVGGELIKGLLSRSSSRIVPVDSEHSAIFQCLEGEDTRRADKIILTASGGPFRTLEAGRLASVTAADALRHPNWDMGAKVTVDSASMMNKGFEMIEAHWLFGCPPDKIEVVVHPQSIVHSMVQFADGSVKAQLGLPDMHLPIRYALGYPDRLPSAAPAMGLAHYGTLTFEAPDTDKFPLLGYAYDAIKAGGNAPCVLNAANEIAVEAFLGGRLRFTDMPRLVAETLAAIPWGPAADYDTLVHTNRAARDKASDLLRSMTL